jgi:hypothetical protein
MRTWNWIIGTVLLAGMTAVGQDHAAVPPQTVQAAQTTLAAQPEVSPAAQPVSVQPAVPQPAASLEPAPPRPHAPAASTAPTTMDQVVDRAIEREHALMDFLKSRNPLVETYLQNLKLDPQLGPVPSEDHYFLGRLDLGDNIDRRDYLTKETSLQSRLLGGLSKLYRFQYQPMGFSWMLFADRQDFDRAHYSFHYARREFVGDVRCFVFDITPRKDTGQGRFVGRIWVEDQDYNVVRLNGTYAPRPKNAYFFHMDSWRLNLVPGYWVPAYIYSEEGDFSYGAKDTIAFKAQTRIWGYNLQKGEHEDELTQVRVDATVNDQSAAAQDASPLEAQREWQQQAEDNVVERLQNAGLLAPEGEVDKVLQTVLNNLVVTNNLDLPRPVRARIMLTSPLETFSVGNTIIVSRGLVDVLPDEGSLAMMLSHELAHIVLGHNLGSKYAFNDRMLFSDESTYNNLGFRHFPEEEATAENKAMELLKNSPYAQKLDTAGLFLREVNARGPQLPALVTAHLGNNFVDKHGAVIRFTSVMKAAPALDPSKIDQVAALPLGGRVKLNPWDDRVTLIKTTPVAITSARDKMPLEVTPFFPRLTRLGENVNPATSSTAAVAASPASGAPAN